MAVETALLASLNSGIHDPPWASQIDWGSPRDFTTGGTFIGDPSGMHLVDRTIINPTHIYIPSINTIPPVTPVQPDMWGPSPLEGLERLLRFPPVDPEEESKRRAKAEENFRRGLELLQALQDKQMAEALGFKFDKAPEEKPKVEEPQEEDQGSEPVDRLQPRRMIEV